MAFDFPASPTTGQTFTPTGGATYVWNGYAWAQQGSPFLVALGGQLSYVSATQLKFAPFNGNYIKINGVFYLIPAAGIAGLGNTGVFVNGTSGQNLAANTTYLIFAFSNAGTITADFRTGATHTTSTTTGNEGVEILIGDDTRSLIGMCRTNSSSQFIYTAQALYVRSWFNEPTVYAAGLNFNVTGIGTTSGFAAIDSGTGFLAWANEVIDAGVYGLAYNATAGADVYTSVMLDGAAPSSGLYGYSYVKSVAANAFAGIAPHLTIAASEGNHVVQCGAYVSAGSGAVIGYTRVALPGKH